MKNIKRSLLVAVVLVFALCLFGCAEKEPTYNEIMSTLDASNTTGKLVTIYDIKDNEYQDDYIPEELLAKTPEEVGYIIKMDFTYDTREVMYFGANITGDCYFAQYVDCSTGEVIAEKNFQPYFPDEVPRDYRAHPKLAEITEWIAHCYPQWGEGQGPGHDFEEATCQAPKTCSYCGKTEGTVTCHEVENGKCIVCEEKFEDELACHTLTWVLNAENAEMMDGSCTYCDAEFSAETDWELLYADIMAGTWKITWYLKGDYYDEYVVVTADITEEGLVIHAPDKDYVIDMQLRYGTVGIDYYSITFNATDEEGNEYSLRYENGEYGEEIRLSDDVYSVYFGRNGI